MRPVNIKTINYRGNLASKRRQTFRLKGVLIALGVLVGVGGIGYAFFYASWFQVKNVNLLGVNEFHQPEVQRAVEQALGRTFMGIPTGRDILFVHADALQASLAGQFPFLNGVTVHKKYFHTLQVVGTERQAEGVWCFNPPAGGTCRYFDHGGVIWGDAIQSSGFLLLNVNDLRAMPSSASLAIDSRFLQAIQTVVPTLSSQGVKVKGIMIPEGSFTEFDVSVSDGYPVKFSLDSDLSSQLDAYRIFRGQKAGDATFHPQYIDMRFDGRVYFK
jgi:hypothetical protein